MRKCVLIILLAVAIYIPVYSQQGGVSDTTRLSNKSHLRISLLTCGPGEELWETFGHSAIRIIDSTKTGRDQDVVYNYGFVESSPDNTVWHQFISGRVLVYLATSTYAEFIYQFTDKKRSVDEQVFLLSDEDKDRIIVRPVSWGCL